MKYLSNIDLAGVSRILNAIAPIADTDLVTKGYVGAEIDKAVAGFDFQADVKAIQVDATLDPGTPILGDRYIITNTAALHASFGTIATVENGDIVEYDGSVFVVAYDVSVKGDGVLVFISGIEQYEKYVSGVWSFGGLTVINAGTGLENIAGTFNVKLDNTTIGLDGEGKLFVQDDSITKAKIAADVAGVGLNQNVDGSLEVKLNDARLAVTASGLALVETYTKKLAVTVGDGVATVIPVTHTLGVDVSVDVFAVADGSSVAVDIARTSETVVTLTFASAPTAGQYRVVIIG